eukprot:COSAG01_NODE_10571_length_2129_cov_4.778376_2_plen_221_part_00
MAVEGETPGAAAASVEDEGVPPHQGWLDMKLKLGWQKRFVRCDGGRLCRWHEVHTRARARTRAPCPPHHTRACSLPGPMRNLARAVSSALVRARVCVCACVTQIIMQDVTVPLDDVLRLSRLESYSAALRERGVDDIPRLVHFALSGGGSAAARGGGGGGGVEAAAAQLGMEAAEAGRLESCTTHWAKALATQRKTQLHGCQRFEEVDARRFRCDGPPVW